MRSKHNSKRIRTLRRRRLALALVTAMAAPVAMAQNLPDLGTVTSGSANIGSPIGTEMTITQTTKGAIIDWDSFNIGAGYGVTFDQQFGNSSVTLNRVIGFGYSSSPSFIDGMLSSNGNVFIINPNGIVFGSGAQVNVGGLVASTLDIDDADFLSGVSSGQYRFSANGTLAGAIWNDGQLTAADGGTIGLIASQINNAGTISATNGSVVFGATSEVTLDYFGDGLTQVTVAGNGLGVSNCLLDCNGGITSSGNVFAQGGHIEMRSNTMDGAPAGNGLFVDPANGGRIWISGNVSARTSGSRRGSIIIDAGMGNIDLGGVEGQTGNVSANGINAGEQAGTISFHGNQLFTYLCVWTAGSCVNNNQLGFINASTYGDGGLAGGTINIDVGRFYHAGVVQASSATGAGGTININADSAEIYNLVFAEGYGGPGGSININANSLLLHRGETPWLGGPGLNYSLATLSAFGNTSGGTVNLDVGNLSMIDLGNVSPDDVNLDPAYRPTINVNGYDGNGGNINVTTNNFTLSSWQYFEATGTQVGGNISITADLIDLAGGLVATGATGGTVSTTTTGSLFAGETAYIDAGTWLVHAPSVRIVSAGNASPGTGAVLTDAALSSTLDGGTSIQLFADGALGSGATGNIHIDGAVNIVHAAGDAAALDLRATAGIYGSYFDIMSTGGPLDLSFTANVNGDNPNGGYVSFFYIGLASNGGDIDMSADGRGVYLEFSQLSSGAGDIAIFGSGDDNGVLLVETDLISTGGDISIDGSSNNAAGARLETVNASSGGGDITIDGVGPDGVWVVYSDLTSAGGNIAIHGEGIYSGAYFHDSIVDSGTGDTTITGTASLDLDGYYPFGVALAGTTLTSTTGDISVVGDAVGGSGVLFWTPGIIAPGITTTSGAVSLTSTGANGLGLEGLDISTDTGDITIVGTATDAGATAGVFVGSSGLQTNGGDISITGTTAGGTGVWLYYGDLSSNGGDITVLGEGGYYGVQVWDATVSSGAGDTVITGVATGSGSNATGVNVRDGSFVSTSGGVTINGSAELGTGVFFGSTGSGPGSSVTTTSGAISVISTGLLGLNVADVPFSTNTGDITLEGHALGNGFGVSVGAGGLFSNGGDIFIAGYSTGGDGVVVSGDIASNGGDISIIGKTDSSVGSSFGVLVNNGVNISSSSGAITMDGSSVGGSGVWLSLNGGGIFSDGGDITFTGSGRLFGGVDILFGTVDSGGGDIDIFGTTDGTGTGFSLFNASMSSGGGDIGIVGHSNGNFGASAQDSGITTAGGAINIAGDSFSSTGVVWDGSPLSTSGGDITISGSSTNGAGAQISGSDIDSAGGDIVFHGESLSSTGLIVSGANVASGAGDISLSGMGVGFGAGVWIGQESAISTTSGDIYIDGTSSTYIGVLLNLGDVTSTSGNIDIMGTGGTVGVRLATGGLTTTSGDINVSGMGGSDAGLRFDAASSLDAGSGVVALAASNAGTSDAIILQGSIASTTAVNLRPYDEADTILLGAGNGFSLSAADLATIEAPLLVIGSAEHAGALRVLEAVDWDGDLTLQNEGGSGGIDIQAAVDVGDNILALASGGDISQTAAGGITAHSLLAIAGGDVALLSAENNVAASSVAGSAGGDFAYEDMDDLAIGEVSSFGYSLIDNTGLFSLSAAGIAAEGNVLVATASGDLTLGADVSGNNIDLVAAEVFHNPGGATLSASNGWRIYARTWEGEERGGLQGDGPFDVFGCAFGDEVCSGLGQGNQFIYQERRLVEAPVAPETVAEWLDEDELDGSATDLLQAAICPVADSASDLLQSGTSKDELAREWLKSRHRLRLSNCIDSKNAPGCRF